MPKYEKFAFMEAGNIDFIGVPIEYDSPSLTNPSSNTKVYLFNSVGDVFVGAFGYLGNLGNFFSGNENSATNSPKLDFKWSDPNDIKSPEYILQVSKDEKFTDVLFETNLSSPEYNAPVDLKLSSGNYYWRVKTVDGQNNESGWSQASSFKIGSMPEIVGLFTILITILVIAAIVFAIITVIVHRANRQKY